ncbi:MAG TPA: cytochrome c oxidase assembly protein [Thermoleophilaceae bacterium]|jgi:cytochrome c oxidase assembly factor CtaG
MFLPLAHVVGGTWEPLQLLPPTLAILAYAKRARTLAAAGRPVPAKRQWSFAGGMVLIFASLVSPVAHLGGELILAHMVQHLVMADLGALLIVLGLTGPLLQPVLALRVARWLHFLVHPAVALPLWAIDLYLWHSPFLYQAALNHQWVHALEHTSFVFFGVTMWMALFGPLPQPEWFGNGAKLLYIVAVRLVGALLGNIFIWSGSVFYPDYNSGEAYWKISPLNDQGIAGTIMMIEGSIVTIVLFGWLFMKTAREAEERQGLIELAQTRGIDLSESRAARAVGAGRGAELRRRIEQAG